MNSIWTSKNWNRKLHQTPPFYYTAVVISVIFIHSTKIYGKPLYGRSRIIGWLCYHKPFSIKTKKRWKNPPHFSCSIKIVICWHVMKERQTPLDSFHQTCIYHRTWHMNCTARCRQKTLKPDNRYISYAKTLKLVISKKILRQNCLPAAISKIGMTFYPVRMTSSWQ